MRKPGMRGSWLACGLETGHAPLVIRESTRVELGNWYRIGLVSALELDLLEFEPWMMGSVHVYLTLTLTLYSNSNLNLVLYVPHRPASLVMHLLLLLRVCAARLYPWCGWVHDPYQYQGEPSLSWYDHLKRHCKWIHTVLLAIAVSYWLGMHCQSCFFSFCLRRLLFLLAFVVFEKAWTAK